MSATDKKSVVDCSAPCSAPPPAPSNQSCPQVDSDLKLAESEMMRMKATWNTLKSVGPVGLTMFGRAFKVRVYDPVHDVKAYGDIQERQVNQALAATMDNYLPIIIEGEGAADEKTCWYQASTYASSGIVSTAKWTTSCPWANPRDLRKYPPGAPTNTFPWDAAPLTHADLVHAITQQQPQQQK